MNYADVCQIFADRNCRLLDTEEEVNEKRAKAVKHSTLHHVRVNYVASCGHRHQVVITNFKLRGTGVLCKECTNKNTKETVKEKGSMVKHIDYSGFAYLNNKLKDTFEIEKTPECCRADMLIRPIHHSKDEWLKVEIKTTLNKIHEMYSFNIIPSKYEDDIVFICLCEADNKIWCLEKPDLSDFKLKLNISKISKYNKFECTTDALKDKLKELYQQYVETKKVCTLDQGRLPKNIYQQREQEYAKIRESLFPDWNFETNGVNGLSYDFMLFNKRVQEKVSSAQSHNKKYRFIVGLRKNGKKIEGKKRNMVPYDKEDFDVLWFHLKDTRIFYVIPMDELIKQGCICTERQSGKQYIIVDILQNDAWYSKYQFSYDNLRKEDISKIFEKE